MSGRVFEAEHFIIILFDSSFYGKNCLYFNKFSIVLNDIYGHFLM